VVDVRDVRGGIAAAATKVAVGGEEAFQEAFALLG